jgi:hypothetical protein
MTPPRPRPAQFSRRPDLPLAPFDDPVEIQMVWCPTPLWFVPDDPAADQLVAQGIPRGRTWTLAELQSLLALPGLTTASARRLALMKLEIDGVLAAVLPRPEDDPGGAGWLPGLDPSPRREPSPRRTPPRPFVPLTSLKHRRSAPRRLGET